MMIAQVTNMKPREFIHTMSDTHIYNNHFEQAREQLAREPKLLPAVTLNPDVTDIFDFKYKDFTLHNYEAAPSIKAPIAI